MPKPIDLEKIVRTSEGDPEKVKTLWATYPVIAKIYNGLTPSTIKRYAAEMRDSKNFRDGIINPGHKIALVKIDRFEQYLIWKSENRYRQQKYD